MIQSTCELHFCLHDSHHFHARRVLKSSLKNQIHEPNVQLLRFIKLDANLYGTSHKSKSDSDLHKKCSRTQKSVVKDACIIGTVYGNLYHSL